VVFKGQDYSERLVLFWGRHWLRVFNFRGDKRLDRRVDKVLRIFEPVNCYQTLNPAINNCLLPTLSLVNSKTPFQKSNSKKKFSSEKN